MGKLNRPMGTVLAVVLASAVIAGCGSKAGVAGEPGSFGDVRPEAVAAAAVTAAASAAPVVQQPASSGAPGTPSATGAPSPAASGAQASPAAAASAEAQVTPGAAAAGEPLAAPAVTGAPQGAVTAASAASPAPPAPPSGQPAASGQASAEPAAALAAAPASEPAEKPSASKKEEGSILWSEFFDNDKQDTPSERFWDLNGKTVSIRGYMGEVLSFEKHWFLVIPAPGAECPFDNGDETYWNKIMIAFTNTGEKLRYTSGPLLIKGRLDVGIKIDESGYKTMFRLYDASFTKLKE